MQSLQKKCIRCYQLIRYYGLTTTVAHFLAQKDEKKFSDIRNKLFLDFIFKLRKKLQIDDSSMENKEDATEFPKIILTMW